MSEKNYIMAIIQVPIEVNNENEYRTMTEHISVSFDKIDRLPNKSETAFSYDIVKQLLNNFLQQDVKLPEEIITDNIDTTNDEKEVVTKIFVSADEIKSRKDKPNTRNVSFRNKKSSSSRYTRKTI
jgi:predicted sulfurtransferase